jgi:ectoine hydroxylase-related dioxygenase (phytanoyl-CoA dioxygenase family)
MIDSVQNLSLENATKELFTNQINEVGYVVIENIITQDFCDIITAELEIAIQKEATFHGTNDYKGFGMLLACPLYGGSFLKILENVALMNPFNWILNETCIVYVYTSSCLPPHNKNYASRIHVDRPHFIPGFIEALGSLILLCDFTKDNGATYVLPGSHNLELVPEEKYFYENASRIIAPRGSVFYFNQRLWHAGGQNMTSEWRHSLGIGMVRSYLKQRIDLPRALDGINLSGLSTNAMQKLGFFSQPPSSIEQYYSLVEKRSYRQPSEWDIGKAIQDRK